MTDAQPGGSTPKQYGLPAGATDLQDLIEYRHMNFALGNIFKACYRRGTCSHSDELRDMRKILWFAQREVDRLEAEGKPTLNGYTVKPADDWPRAMKPGPVIYQPSPRQEGKTMGTIFKNPLINGLPKEDFQVIP